MEIRNIESTDYPAFERYVADWKKDTSPFLIDDRKEYDQVTAENFSAWVEKLHREETRVERPDWSTATKYFAFIKGEIAGVISCRWQIEKGVLLEWGGHIGYGVVPSFRGQHLSEKMVAFALEKYRARGISRVMISAHEKNLASRKTIERNGGVLENVVDIENSKICRYWIQVELDE